MTKKDLAELARLAEAATPGPWTATNDGSIAFGEVKQNTRSHVRIAKGGGWLFETCDPEFKRKADQKFIAAANPQAVLGLIARIEKLEAALGFYADEASWYLHKDPVTGSEVRRSVVLEDTESYSFQESPGSPNILCVTAGKIAREALTTNIDERGES